MTILLATFNSSSVLGIKSAYTGSYHLNTDWSTAICITKKYLYNFDPLKPHFYIVKLRMRSLIWAFAVRICPKTLGEVHFKVFVFVQARCTLTIDLSAANNYSDGGIYAVAVTVEDFPKTSLLLDGIVVSPATALSSVPLQVNKTH